MARCNNPKNDHFLLYGGRGIRVCDRWKKFENFYADMGDKPAGKSIDRIDNNGNYELGNCQWATPSQQSRNRRSVTLTYEAAFAVVTKMLGGESKCAIAREYGVSRNVLYSVLIGKSWKDASDAAKAAAAEAGKGKGVANGL